MKKVVFIYTFILFFSISLRAQDSLIVYSTDYLDGDMSYAENGGFYNMSTISLGFYPGDWVQYTSYDRGYLSFDMPLILFNDSTEIDSAEVGVYLYNGQSNIGNYSYPIWDVPGGDTLFCIMDLIDYGPSLDYSDWTAGDPGDPQTIVSNIGVLCSYFNIGFQKMQVGSYIETLVQEDYERCQFRVRFPINTDYDNHWDFLCFYTSDIGIDFPEKRPYLKIFYHIITSVTENSNREKEKLMLSSYPNPFSSSTTISFNIHRRDAKNAEIKIYNVKGQLVKCLECGESLSTKAPMYRDYSINWDGKDEDGKEMPNGIYFCRLSSGDKSAVKKMLLLR